MKGNSNLIKKLSKLKIYSLIPILGFIVISSLLKKIPELMYVLYHKLL